MTKGTAVLIVATSDRFSSQQTDGRATDSCFGFIWLHQLGILVVNAINQSHTPGQVAVTSIISSANKHHLASDWATVYKLPFMQLIIE